MAKKDMKMNELHWSCGCGSGYGFAVLLIILGAFFIARDLGWIPSSVSFWPVVLLAFGLYLLFKPRRKRY